MNRREIRRLARGNAIALLQVNAEAGEGDLWEEAEDLTDEEQDVFLDEIQRIARRIEP